MKALDIKETHWKVGDNMGTGPNDPAGFGIGQIAIVFRGDDKYDIVFFDRNGEKKGKIPVVLRK